MWYNMCMKINYYKDNSDTHKRCSICGELKERSEFHKSSDRKDGLSGYCKPCKIEKNQKWREENPGKWQDNLNSRIWYVRSKKYGVTREKFMEMLKSQNNLCSICKKEIDESASVDHCHNTGQVRGLLCRNCNAGIGLFEDNVESLRNAIQYLSIYK
jgi:Recombination endonuclease VII